MACPYIPFSLNIVIMYEALKIAASDSTFPRWSLQGQVCAGIAVSVYDGDTFDAVLSIPSEGDIIRRLTIRMLGYNSPELKVSRTASDAERMKQHENAVMSRDTLWKLLGGDEREILRIECGEWDKYGRLLAHVYRLAETPEGCNC